MNWFDIFLSDCVPSYDDADVSLVDAPAPYEAICGPRVESVVGGSLPLHGEVDHGVVFHCSHAMPSECVGVPAPPPPPPPPLVEPMAPPSRAAPMVPPSSKGRKKKKAFSRFSLSHADADAPADAPAEALVAHDPTEASGVWADMGSDNSDNLVLSAEAVFPPAVDDGWGATAGLASAQPSYADVAKTDFLSIFVQWKDASCKRPHSNDELRNYFVYFGRIHNIRIPTPQGRPFAFIGFVNARAHADALKWSQGPYFIRQATVSKHSTGIIPPRPR